MKIFKKIIFDLREVLGKYSERSGKFFNDLMEILRCFKENLN